MVSFTLRIGSEGNYLLCLKMIDLQTQDDFVGLQRVLIRRIGGKAENQREPFSMIQDTEVISSCLRKTESRAHFPQNHLSLEQKSEAAGKG